MLIVSFISISPGAKAVNFYLRSGTSTCIYDGNASQTLQLASGSSQSSIAFSAQTNTFSFYSAPLTNAVPIGAGKKVGGTIGVQNNGSADFQFNASEVIYDYDPATGNQTKIVATSASGWATASKNGKTGHATVPQTKVGASHTIPTNHLLEVTVTVAVNISSGINGALIYDAASGDGKSLIQFPVNGGIIWPFGSFPSTPNATITVPSSVQQNSTNSASVVSAGAGATYIWSITNGTITAGQSTPQITWTAGASGSVGLGVSIVDGCFSSSGASTVVLTVKSNQTVTFNPISTQTYGNSPISLVATASSGLPVTFSLVSGPATVSGSALTITGAGTVIVDANQAGNSTYNPGVAQQSFGINPQTLTVTGITANNKVYDSTTTATINTNSSALVGVISGDSITLDLTFAAGYFTNDTVGTGVEVDISGLDITGASAGNYTLVQPITSADITPAGLTVSGITASDKVYDGTTAATLNTGSAALVGVITGDNVTLDATSASGVFADKNVGAGKTVTISGLAIAGTDAGNYTLTQPTATASITAQLLTVSATGINKIYDGTATAMVTLSDNRVSGDSLSTSYTSASFSDKNVGTGKTVSVTGISASGADAGNYSYNTAAATTANITAASVSGSITAANKVYDGTTAATIMNGSLSGVIGADNVSLIGGTAVFSDKNVGTGKIVTTTGLSLTGTDAGDYSLASSGATTAANITVRSLTVSATGVNKVYDGTATATVTLSDDRVPGDSLSISYVGATFSDKNVGTGKAVSVTGISTTGADAANYSYNSTSSTTADITAASVSGSVTASDKVYDGTTAATISSRNLTGVIGNDSVSLTGGTATFSDQNVGTNKTVTATGLSITGTDAGNYTLASSTATTTASIMAPPQAPSIAISMGPDGAHIDCTGIPGQPFAIQATMNLTSGNWTTIYTNAIGTNGLSSYIDPAVGGRPVCFYRAMVSY